MTEKCTHSSADSAEVRFGFASYSDRKFELIAVNIKTGDEIMLEGQLRPDQTIEQIDKVLPTCVYVTGASKGAPNLAQDAEKGTTLGTARVTQILEKHIKLDWLNASDGKPDIVGIEEAAAELLRGGPHGAPQRIAMAAALARKLCQLFDSGGESQRTVRARHASAIFQLLEDDTAEHRSHQQRADIDPVGYLNTAETYALTRPTLGRDEGQS